MTLETQLQSLVSLAIEEDGERDVTGEALCSDQELGEGFVIAKQAGVICGIRFLSAIVQAISADLVLEPFVEDGDEIRQRMMILSMTGKKRAIFRVERILLNFLARLSGIASLTRQFVNEVEDTGVVILDTRKTTPGWRYLDKYAVKIGGGVNHRFGLDDIALIKGNHVDSCGGVEKAILLFRETESETPLIVEVRTMVEFREALTQAKKLTRILLDNWTPDQMKEAVEVGKGRVLLEASGNMTLENVRTIAQTGVHFLSIGALTHSAPAVDFSFQLSREASK